SRLRIIGALDNHVVRLIDAPRLDDGRDAGPGAPIDLGLTAVCWDAHGHELGQSPLRGYRSSNPAFVALVPLTAAVAHVELRSSDGTALRIERPSAAPQLGQIGSTVDGGRMTVTWRLVSGSALEAVLEAATLPDGEDQPIRDWVPISAMRGCRDRHVL